MEAARQHCLTPSPSELASLLGPPPAGSLPSEVRRLPASSPSQPSAAGASSCPTGAIPPPDRRPAGPGISNDAPTTSAAAATSASSSSAVCRRSNSSTASCCPRAAAAAAPAAACPAAVASMSSSWACTSEAARRAASLEALACDCDSVVWCHEMEGARPEPLLPALTACLSRASLLDGPCCCCCCWCFCCWWRCSESRAGAVRWPPPPLPTPASRLLGLGGGDSRWDCRGLQWRPTPAHSSSNAAAAVLLAWESLLCSCRSAKVATSARSWASSSMPSAIISTDVRRITDQINAMMTGWPSWTLHGLTDPASSRLHCRTIGQADVRTFQVSARGGASWR